MQNKPRRSKNLKEYETNTVMYVYFVCCEGVGYLFTDILVNLINFEWNQNLPDFFGFEFI